MIQLESISMTFKFFKGGEKMLPKIRAYLYIVDFNCSPEKITSLLGINPTKVWFRGDKIGKSNRIKSSNGWMLESILVNEPDPEVHIQWLISQLPETLEKLRSETLKWDAQVSLVLEMVDDTPPLNLTKETISRMAQLGLGLDIDIFWPS